MRLIKNSSGLYEFDVHVRGPKKEKTLKGLIDTGSTDCACTYKLITTLWIRPISFTKVSTVNVNGAVQNTSKPAWVYSALIKFDNKEDMFNIIRVSSLPQNISLLLGMSFLSRCQLNFDGDRYLDINWLT
ncbi:MAG: retroviral-like aspartic protease family protein [Candidatus Omnitrophica bacterium]|nr:retroviral-like aspartic protease family protein [Candidatus Omnitrophota bacterium]